MSSPTIPLSVFRAAWRDLKRELRRQHGAVGVTRPTLSRSPEGDAVVIETWAVTVGLDWVARIQVPLGWGALRLGPPLLRTLQRLARREIGRSSAMTCDEWTHVQDAARLGLATIARDHGWLAAITPAGEEAIRRGWIP